MAYIREGKRGTALAVQWLGPGTFTARAPGSIPCWGTKIPQAAQSSQKSKWEREGKKVLQLEIRVMILILGLGLPQKGLILKLHMELFRSRQGCREQGFLGWVLPTSTFPQKRREVVPEGRDTQDVAYGDVP